MSSAIRGFPRNATSRYKCGTIDYLLQLYLLLLYLLEKFGVCNLAFSAFSTFSAFCTQTTFLCPSLTTTTTLSTLLYSTLPYTHQPPNTSRSLFVRYNHNNNNSVGFFATLSLESFPKWRKRVEKPTRTTTKCLLAKAMDNMHPLLLCNILLKQQTMHTKATPTLNISSLHPTMLTTSKTPVPHPWQQPTGSKPLIRSSSSSTYLRSPCFLPLLHQSLSLHICLGLLSNARYPPSNRQY